MILRKPYAFFIKYFRVIHLIMAFFMWLLILQTNSFLTFFNEYINSNAITIGQDLVSQIFMKLTYLYIAIVLIMDVIVWVLLEFKHKKRLFYIVNFFGYVLVLALSIYINSLLSTMSQEVVDVRLIMTIRDLVIIIFSYQTLSMFIVASRFFGFDIKKFNFEDDIKELNIMDTDNEEFEINLNFDIKRIKRSFIENIRNFKYYVRENLRLIIPLFSTFVIVVCILVYKNLSGYTTTIKQNVEFSVPNYRMNVVDSYTTSKNYKSETIDEQITLVVLKVNIKATNNINQFIFGKFSLKIGDDKFYHTINYSDDIKDLGNTYIKQKLTNTYQTFLLVYEIPSELKDKKKQLIYVNDFSNGLFKKDNVTKIEIKTTDLDKEIQEKLINLDETVSFENDLSSITSLKIRNLEIANVFQVKYNKCISTYECYKFYEPIQADFYGSYDKSLLKIDLDINNYSFSSQHVQYIEMYVKINYKINNKLKVFNIKKQVTLQKVKSSSYYFEIPKEVLDADEIIFEFSTRNNKLIYKIPSN